ncbi:CDP-alcohol phosphatidyltransferase family protein [Candidatus Saccharibacteria bacterium]|nr:CDP-alcohol phosphatidyltransferase family protein [Candidatus Saccharibacteria bacterium]
MHEDSQFQPVVQDGPELGSVPHDVPGSLEVTPKMSVGERIGTFVGDILRKTGLIDYDPNSSLSHQRPLDRDGDWDGIPNEELTRPQRLAKRSKGWLTAGNAVSFVGAGLTFKGIYDFAQGDTVQGVAQVAAGRALDLFDGIVAAWTKTRGKVGALVDSGLDKILSATGLGVLTFETHDLPASLSVPIFAQQALIVAMNKVIHNKGGAVTPNRAGKWGMAALWGYLGAPIAYRAMEAAHWDHADAMSALGYISGVGALALSAVSIYDYRKQIQQLSSDVES